MSHEFTQLWKQYEPFIKGIIELFHPFVEIAVHDLKKGEIVAIYHNISRREVGNPSPLKELKVETEEFPDYFTPYYKQNWDGRPLKCTSITMRDHLSKAVGLICINIDVSFFHQGFDLMKTFLEVKEGSLNPVESYGSPPEEQIETFIREFLEEKHLSEKHLNRAQKKALVQHLYQKGVFNFKNAVPILAKQLSITRASIYNYIKEIA